MKYRIDNYLVEQVDQEQRRRKNNKVKLLQNIKVRGNKRKESKANRQNRLTNYTNDDILDVLY
ncbi:hypothetical protein GA597_03050 [Staphylococcus haemolyticus]|uniref:hypothetical protein n=1 Tax=Staphylococcus haemolyticus TaxID=1283 RepID=UPI0012647CFD|nr:hypothetical protein [Staphylococcus haemolyticus]QFR05888.1 hypothetical protein GA597_03050 [Staphylococcus haemolyticus]